MCACARVRVWRMVLYCDIVCYKIAVRMCELHLVLTPSPLQVLRSYLEDDSIHVDNDTAVKLGCLELRRFYKDMPQIALKKKENFTMLE